MRKGFTIVELLIIIVVIGVLAAISVVAYNGITNRAKAAAMYSEVSQWKKKSEIYKITNNIVCPDNYVFVYGNSVLGTSDFCVMKYEAKIQGNNDGTTTYSSSMVAESRASGTPWVNITQTNAITEATAIGGHILTEAEWMTIAADVLSVKWNWSRGEVGSGLIYQGHVNNNPASGLAASADDTDVLNGLTGGTGVVSGNNSSRVLYLSSGDPIWDFSGNVWEWTQVAIGTPALTVSQVGVVGDTTFSWRQWNLESFNFGNLPTESRSSTLSDVPALMAINSWNSAQGIGMMYVNYSDNASRAILRGGNWGGAGSAYGVLSGQLAYAPTSAVASFGFRVAR